MLCQMDALSTICGDSPQLQAFLTHHAQLYIHTDVTTVQIQANFGKKHALLRHWPETVLIFVQTTRVLSMSKSVLFYGLQAWRWMSPTVSLIVVTKRHNNNFQVVYPLNDSRHKKCHGILRHYWWIGLLSGKLWILMMTAIKEALRIFYWLNCVCVCVCLCEL